MPALTRDACASVLVASPSGNSSAKSGSTRTTPSAAGDGRRGAPRLRPRRSNLSDNLEDLDPGSPRDTGPVHPRA